MPYSVKSYKINKFFILIVLVLYAFHTVSAHQEKLSLEDSARVPQKDIIDVYHKLTNREERKDTSNESGKGPFISIIPVVGYYINTGITAEVTAYISFYTDEERKKMSRVILDGNCSQFHQYWLTCVYNIFMAKHKLHIFGDTRYYKFPTQTYGLGPDSPLSNHLKIDYSYLRLYQVVFHEIKPNLFLGLGYNLDYYWNIKTDSVPENVFEQFRRYQQGSNSISSGISLNILFDSRKNAINPRNGTLVNLQFRPNMTFLGSDKKWQSLLIEIRHYIKLPARSRNILALWSYSDITLSGSPSYLDMPSIGWDDYSSTGRGYAPGRYTGRSLYYFESEYRYSLTRNGILGGVIFGNAQIMIQPSENKKPEIVPGGGLGLRIKVNKYSDTNLSIDYGIGIRGSHGLFINMGEFF